MLRRRLLIPALLGLSLAGCDRLLPVVTVSNSTEAAWASWNSALTQSQRIEDEITGKMARWDHADPRLMREVADLRERQATFIEKTSAPIGGADFRSRWFKVYKQYAEWSRIYAGALERSPGVTAWVFGQTEVSRNINRLEDGLRADFASLLTDYGAWVERQGRPVR